MALTGAHAPGATPLTEEDVQGLKIASITTQGELNEAEGANIIRGQEWALRTRLATLPDMLSDEYLQRLHAEMFGDVWKWAGEYRQRVTNIGVDPLRIRTDLRQLYDEVRGWLDYQSYPPDEIAIRLHYRVVTIHPFPNGNGRHARLLADMVMVRHFKADPLPWGGSLLRGADGNRTAYIQALVAADRRDFGPLLTVAVPRGERTRPAEAGLV
ncbi:MAG TPA: mobile mystery protein B, partial [Polyangiaceae bacterium]|nr:mobile mystery protein B [Polyangiaceae bacterium]